MALDMPSMPVNRMPKPTMTMPRCCKNFFLMNTTKITPIKISTGAMALIFSPMRKLVTVVPMLAPMMIYTDCSSLSSPALRKPTTMTVVAEEDWMAPVTTTPTRMPSNGLEVIFSSSPLRREPTSSRPSPISFMPNRNIPSPPSRVNTCV